MFKTTTSTWKHLEFYKNMYNMCDLCLVIRIKNVRKKKKLEELMTSIQSVLFSVKNILQ